MVVVVGFLFFCALNEDLIERTKHPQDFACGFFLFFFLLVESQLPHRQHCQPMGSKFQPCGATMVGTLRMLIPTMWPKIFLESATLNRVHFKLELFELIHIPKYAKIKITESKNYKIIYISE